MPNYAYTELEAGDFWQKIMFGLLAASGVIMAMTCFWNMNALFGKWVSFVEVWRTVLM